MYWLLLRASCCKQCASDSETNVIGRPLMTKGQPSIFNPYFRTRDACRDVVRAV